MSDQPETAVAQLIPGKRVGYHPVAKMFPLIEGEQFVLFCQDLKTHGQREPILWVPGEPGDGLDVLIVDGRNRYRGCEVLGVEPAMEQWDGTGSLAELAASLNFFRRHLTPSQRAAAGVAIKRQYAAEGEVRMLAGKRPDGTAAHPGEKVPQGERALRARDRAAKVCDVNARYIDAAEQVAEQAPETFAALVAGKVSIGEAKRAVHRDRKTKAARAVAAAAPPLSADACEIITGDFVKVAESQPAGKVRLIFADPPYNCGVDYGKGAKADRRAPADYMAWTYNWLRECHRLLTPDGSIFVLIDRANLLVVGDLVKTYGFNVRNVIVWHETFGVYEDGNFASCARFVVYATKSRDDYVFNGDAVRVPSSRQTDHADKRADPAGRVPGNVWSVPRLVDNAAERVPGFPTQVPRAVTDRIVLACSEPGDLVADPFTGSGTTAVSAVTAGRRYWGTELNKAYAAEARQRVAAAVAAAGTGVAS